MWQHSEFPFLSHPPCPSQSALSTKLPASRPLGFSCAAVFSVLHCRAEQKGLQHTPSKVRDFFHLLTVGSGGLFHEGRQMSHWELMVALDVSCLLSLSFTLGLWGFILWGAPDGPLWVDGGSGCELPPLTLFYFMVLGIRFMRGANMLLSYFFYTFYLV